MLINSGGGIYFEMYRNPLTIFLFLLFLIYLFLNKKVYFLKAYIIIFLLFIVLLFINYQFAIKGQIINPYGYFVLTALIALLANTTLSRTEFLDSFIKALNFYKYHALLTYLAFFIIKDHLVYFEFGEDKHYYTFFYIFFSTLGNNLREFYSITYLRNNGLFWEPGILQIFMNILLFIQLFLVKSTKFQKLSTIFVVITTFSTTGLVLLTFTLIVKYLSTLTFSRFIKTLPIILVFLLSFLPVLLYNVEEKVSGEKADSAQVRFFDALQSLIIISDYPATGIGLTLKPYTELQKQFYGTAFGVYSPNPEGNTNSILNTLVFLGIPFGLILLYALYKQNIFYNKKYLFFLIIIISLMSEPLLLRPFFMFIVFNGFLYIFLDFFKVPLQKKRRVTHSLTFKKTTNSTIKGKTNV